MDLLNAFSPPFIVWQLLSLCPFSYDRKSKRFRSSRCNKSVFVATVVILFAALAFEALDFDFGIVADNEYAVIEDSVMNYGVLVPFLAIVIVAETWIKRTKQIEYLKRIDQIDRILLINLRTRSNYGEYNSRQQKMFAFRMVLSICLAISRLATAVHFGDWDFSVSVLISLLPVHLAAMHYHRIDAFVDMINGRYETVNQVVESAIVAKKPDKMPTNRIVAELQRKVSKRTTRDKSISDYAQAQQLDNIRKVYNLLLDANEMLRNLFNWSTFLCMMLDFQRTVMALLWMYLSRDLFSHVQLFAVLLEVALKAFNFVSLLSTCEATIAKVIAEEGTGMCVA